MSDGNCAHCGTHVGYFDEAVFGDLTLHTSCVSKFKAENPGATNAARLRKSGGPGILAIYYGENCAQCSGSVDHYESAIVNGKTVHASCVSSYHRRLADRAEAEAIVAVGALGVMGVATLVSTILGKSKK